MFAIYGKQEIYTLLKSKGIPYEALEHEAVYTMEDMDKVGITAKGGVCKNLFLQDAKGKIILLSLSRRGGCRVDFKLLCRVIEEHGKPVKIIKFE